LFGSTLKGTNRPDSDVDLLVEFEPGATPGLLTMAQIEIDLGAGGRAQSRSAHGRRPQPLFPRRGGADGGAAV
jgi:hypothetical protein